jgi:hypothetical protein
MVWLRQGGNGENRGSGNQTTRQPEQGGPKWKEK